MREIIVPPLVNVDPDTNVTDLVVRQAAKASNPALFSRLDAAGQWQDVRATDFLADVSALAKGLMASGVAAGDRVGIMSRTRYEWALIDFAIWFAGAVSVPIYETSSPSQVAWNLGDSGAVAAFGESAHHEDIIRQAATSEGLTALRHVWQLEGDSLDEVRAAGAGISDAELEARRSQASLNDIATIIYTSGTTGRPKGCELTHGNFVELSENALVTSLGTIVHEQARTIMFLPMAHVFARFISVLAVAAGVTVAHTPDIKNLLPDLQSYKPTFILAVPRVFEKVYNSALTKAEDGGKGAIFHRAADTAIEFSRARQAGKVGLVLKLKHALFDKLVYSKLRAAMGGHVSHAVSGGGPLGERLGHFFQGIGMQILEGYGLTETTAPVTVNTPDLIKIGTVGAPIPGNSVRIADDGEILAKGVCVMRGYYKRDDLSAATFDDDGWFRTGDIGQLDEAGVPDHHRAQEGNHRHGRRQERGPGPAGRPDPGGRARLAGARGGRQPPVHRRPGDPGRRSPSRLAGPPRAPGLDLARRGCRATRRSRPPSRSSSTTPTSRCPRPRRSSPSGSCRPTSPRPPAI